MTGMKDMFSPGEGGDADPGLSGLDRIYQSWTTRQAVSSPAPCAREDIDIVGLWAIPTFSAQKHVSRANFLTRTSQPALRSRSVSNTSIHECDGTKQGSSKLRAYFVV